MSTRCPTCYGSHVIKNGYIHSGKPKLMCKDCGRQFVLNPSQRRISDDTKTLIDRLLKEKISLAAIARAVQVSERWLHQYINKKQHDQDTYHVQSGKKRGR